MFQNSRVISVHVKIAQKTIINKAFVIIMNHVIQRSLIIFSGINIIQNLMLDIIKVNKTKLKCIYM